MIYLKTREEIELMRESALMVSRTLGLIAAHVRPGVTPLHLDKLADFYSIMPPDINEQTAIATYLDTKTQTIDNITHNLKKQIDTLKELRKTLINDVVTGKIKVI